MKLLLKREYWPNGTNGKISIDGVEHCMTIELPWKDNRRNISCIPEGTYGIEKHCSERWGWHLRLKEVKGRSGILLHPANDALRELRGCIAPVTKLTGEGMGTSSRLATWKLRDYVFARMELGEEVSLEVYSDPEQSLHLYKDEFVWTEELFI